MVAEPVGGLQLESGPAAFLLIGGDPVPAGGAYRGQAQQRPGGVAQRLVAVLADVDADRFGMQVPAVAAAPGGGGDRAFLARFGWRQGHADDLVAGALVVDDRAGAELADADEPGPLDVVPFAVAGQAGDVGGQRQAGEGIAGQESLGGEVAVGVEVGLEVVGVLVAEQGQLDAGVAGPPGGVVAFLVRDRDVHRAGRLGVELLQREPVQVPPAPARVVERLRRLADRIVDPAVPPPRRRGQARRHPGEHGLDPDSGALCRSRVGKPLADLGQEFQAGAGAADIQHVGERPAQVLAGFGEPDRLDVRPDQVLVRQVQARRGDRSADHIGRPPEVVLVVGVAGRAVRHHQRGLPGSSRAPGPLRVVGRRRRHVAQPDGAQRVDVHPEFHRRRAVQDRQRGLAELALAFLPFGGRDLGGVLLGAQPGQGRGDGPVQLAEERVDPRALLVIQGPPHPVFGTGQPAPGLPVDHRRPQPVTRNVVLAGQAPPPSAARPRAAC